jgi:hypothetical protein
MKVALLTTSQKNLIEGKEFAPDSLFNPLQDLNNKWVISLQEIELATIPPYEWLKELPLIDFEPKKTTI